MYIFTRISSVCFILVLARSHSLPPSLKDRHKKKWLLLESLSDFSVYLFGKVFVFSRFCVKFHLKNIQSFAPKKKEEYEFSFLLCKNISRFVCFEWSTIEAQCVRVYIIINKSLLNKQHALSELCCARSFFDSQIYVQRSDFYSI